MAKPDQPKHDFAGFSHEGRAGVSNPDSGPLSAEDLALIDTWARKIALAMHRGQRSGAHDMVDAGFATMRQQNRPPLLATGLAEMGVDVRSCNALEREREITTVGDLLKTHAGDLLTIHNFSFVSAVGVYATLLRYTVKRVIELERVMAAAD